MCCSPAHGGGGWRTDLLGPRYHPYPPPVPGRHCSSASRWQCLVLELSTILMGPSWCGQVSEQMPGPRHVSRTCQPVEQSWKVPGPFPVLRPLPKGGAQGAQEGQMDVLEAASGLPPGKWKGNANSCQERDMFFSFLFLKPHLHVPKEGSKGSGSLPVLEGKGVRWPGSVLDLPCDCDPPP